MKKAAANQFSLEGRVAVVTGGGRGLGESAARTFAGAGASVVLLGRDRARLETVAQSIRTEFATDSLPLVADVMDPASLRAAADRTAERFGRVDILLNNAGVATATSVMETNDADWNRVIETNLSGVHRVVRAFAPMMMTVRYGRIIMIGSLMADRVAANRASYCASKAGLVHLGRAMALEFGPFGITVNSICPAVIKTDLNREQMEVHAVEAYNKLLLRVPLGRFGNPADLSGALLFFASDASAYVTGQEIYVDGGLGIT